MTPDAEACRQRLLDGKLLWGAHGLAQDGVGGMELLLQCCARVLHMGEGQGDVSVLVCVQAVGPSCLSARSSLLRWVSYRMQGLHCRRSRMHAAVDVLAQAKVMLTRLELQRVTIWMAVCVCPALFFCS